jgi:hypothetical protein
LRILGGGGRTPRTPPLNPPLINVFISAGIELPLVMFGYEKLCVSWHSRANCVASLKFSKSFYTTIILRWTYSPGTNAAIFSFSLLILYVWNIRSCVIRRLYCSIPEWLFYYLIRLLWCEVVDKGIINILRNLDD